MLNVCLLSFKLTFCRKYSVKLTWCHMIWTVALPNVLGYLLHINEELKIVSSDGLYTCSNEGLKRPSSDWICEPESTEDLKKTSFWLIQNSNFLIGSVYGDYAVTIWWVSFLLGVSLCHMQSINIFHKRLCINSRNLCCFISNVSCRQFA